MLLSDPATALFINREFVASWECVRPVPKVTIDFGNGKVLKRTLAGNTVLYICLPDGRVVDALPGVYTPQAFLSEAAKALAQIQILEQPNADTNLESALISWHKKQFGDAILSEKRRITMSKAIVESPLLKALGIAPKGAVTVPAAVTENGPALFVGNMDLASAYATLISRMEDISHQPASARQARKIVRPDGQPGNLSPEELGRMAVEIDSTNNLRLVRPAVHMLMALSNHAERPADLRDSIYKQILRVPIDDPVLGLAEIAVPGTP